MDFNKGITVEVFVEADTADEANMRAKLIGLYFNGCDDGIDCDCCGDRWYKADDGCRSEKLPSKVSGYMSWVKDPKKEGVAHYKSGKIKWLAFSPFKSDKKKRAVKVKSKPKKIEESLNQ